MLFNGMNVLITGGTGSLGKTLLKRLLSGSDGTPKRIIILSRDEAKQFFLREEYRRGPLGGEFDRLVKLRVGDIRDYPTVESAMRDINIVINAAALKQVPSCENHPVEAVKTNVLGAENIARAAVNMGVREVIGVSTDKACKPVNVMGMTKAIQERIFISANTSTSVFRCVRYGNVLASRGSVIPLFHEQILAGGPITVTTADMTRFLLTLQEAVNVIFGVLKGGLPGDIFIPRCAAANIMDLAQVLSDGKTEVKVTGIRPGEKIHEELVSSEEIGRTRIVNDKWFAIEPIAKKFSGENPASALPGFGNGYASNNKLLDKQEVRDLLERNGLLAPIKSDGDILV